MELSTESAVCTMSSVAVFANISKSTVGHVTLVAYTLSRSPCPVIIAFVLPNNRSMYCINSLRHIHASDGWFSSYTTGCRCEETVFMETWTVAGLPLGVAFVAELVAAPITENPALQFLLQIE